MAVPSTKDTTKQKNHTPAAPPAQATNMNTTKWVGPPRATTPDPSNPSHPTPKRACLLTRHVTYSQSCHHHQIPHLPPTNPETFLHVLCMPAWPPNMCPNLLLDQFSSRLPPPRVCFISLFSVLHILPHSGVVNSHPFAGP